MTIGTRTTAEFFTSNTAARPATLDVAGHHFNYFSAPSTVTTVTMPATRPPIAGNFTLTTSNISGQTSSNRLYYNLPAVQPLGTASGRSFLHLGGNLTVYPSSSPATNETYYPVPYYVNTAAVNTGTQSSTLTDIAWGAGQFTISFRYRRRSVAAAVAASNYVYDDNSVKQDLGPEWILRCENQPDTVSGSTTAGNLIWGIVCRIREAEEDLQFGWVYPGSANSWATGLNVIWASGVDIAESNLFTEYVIRRTASSFTLVKRTNDNNNQTATTETLLGSTGLPYTATYVQPNATPNNRSRLIIGDSQNGTLGFGAITEIHLLTTGITTTNGTGILEYAFGNATTSGYTLPRSDTVFLWHTDYANTVDADFYVDPGYVDPGYFTLVETARANLASVIAVAAQGGYLESAAATITAVATVTAAALDVQPAAALIASSGTITAVGLRRQPGAAAASIAATVAATPVRIQESTAAFTTTAVIAESSILAVPAEAQLLAEITVSETSQQIVTAQASITSQATISATATVDADFRCTATMAATAGRIRDAGLDTREVIWDRPESWDSWPQDRWEPLGPELLATGNIQAQGQSGIILNLSAVDVVTAQALRTARTAAAIAAQWALANTGTRLRISTAAANTQADLIASPQRRQESSADLYSQLQQIALARVDRTGSAAVTAQSSQTADGFAGFLGAASLIGIDTIAVVASILNFDPDLTLQIQPETRQWPVLADYRQLNIQAENGLNIVLGEARDIVVKPETRQEQVL